MLSWFYWSLPSKLFNWKIICMKLPMKITFNIETIPQSEHNLLIQRRPDCDYCFTDWKPVITDDTILYRPGCWFVLRPKCLGTQTVRQPVEQRVYSRLPSLTLVLKGKYIHLYILFFTNFLFLFYSRFYEDLINWLM